MGTPKDSEKTRARLIEAAGKLFAERGINGVTVRDIAREAKKPLSAINYHFRTKEALYREVLLEACKADAISVKEQEKLLKLEPRTALFTLIEEALKEYHSQSASSWQTVVITRECWEPSQVFEEIAREYWVPEMEFLCRIVGSVVGKDPNDNQVRFAVVCLIGLVDTFGFYGHLIEAVAPDLMKYLAETDNLAWQILELVTQAAKGDAA